MQLQTEPRCGKTYSVPGLSRVRASSLFEGMPIVRAGLQDMPRGDAREVLRASSGAQCGAVAASKPAASGNPLTIFGAAVLQWVNGNASTTLSTTSWTDASSAGKDYTGTLTVTATDSTLNNKKTASFNGTSNSLTSALVLPQSGTTPTCILSVVKYRSLGVAQAAAYTNPSATQNNWCIYNGSGASQYASYNGTTVIVVPSSNVYIGAWARTRNDFSNSAGDITRIGSLSVTGNSGNAAAAGSGRTISGFAGSLAAIDVWDLLYLNIIPNSTQMGQYDAWVTAQTGGAAAV